MYKKTKDWEKTLEAFNLIAILKLSDAVRILTPSFLAPKQVKPEFQGEYIHRDFVHFIAEYVSIAYAFKDYCDYIYTKSQEKGSLEINGTERTPQNRFDLQ